MRGLRRGFPQHLYRSGIIIIMHGLLTIPNELLDDISSYLNPLATFNLLITCRSFSSRLAPAMLRHAVAPKGGFPALHWAVLRKHLPLVQRLVTILPVDFPDDTGSTALHAAAMMRNNLPILELLLLHGADVTHIDDQGLTALDYACEPTNRPEASVEATVRLLIAHGADANVPSENPPLRRALDSPFLRVAKLLLDAGANPNIKSKHGEPLVVIVARARHPEALQLLFNYGADINATDSSRDNPLLIAAKYGPLEMVKVLVENGANLGCVAHNGNTPLILAVMNEHQDIAEYLVGLEGVDIVSLDGTGISPVSLAVLALYDDLLRKLLERGAQVDHENQRGLTALHIAVLMERIEIVEILLEHGADTEIADPRGDTPLLSAMKMGSVPISSILITGGADTVRSGMAGPSPLSVASQMGVEGMLDLFQ